MTYSRSLEPFDGQHLTRWLEAAGAKFIRQSGSHVHYDLNGIRVGSVSAGPVPCSLTRDMARRLGLTYPELRSRLGFPVVQRNGAASRPQPTVRRPAERARYSKGDAITAIEQAGARLRSLHEALRCGVRDAAVYEEVVGSISDMNPSLRRMEDRL